LNRILLENLLESTVIFFRDGLERRRRQKRITLTREFLVKVKPVLGISFFIGELYVFLDVLGLGL
jgi:hypothetical protein